MIETNKYNDFTKIKITTKEQFIADCETFIEKGGDLTLPIISDGYDLKLISFLTFVSNHKNLGSETINELILKNILNSPTDFIWDVTNQSIFLPKELSLNDLHAQFIKNPTIITNSFKNLLLQLPKNLYDIKKFGEFSTYQNKYEISSYHHPLLKILLTLSNDELYQMVFDKYPEFVNLLQTKKNDGFLYELCLGNYHNEKTDILKTLYINNVLPNKFEKDNIEQLKRLLQHCIFIDDISVVTKILKFNALSMIENDSNERFHASELFIKKANSFEMTKLLLENGAKTSIRKSHVFDVVDSTEKIDPNTFKYILDLDKTSKTHVEKKPDLIFKILGAKYKVNPDDYVSVTKLLVKELKVDTKNIDILNFLSLHYGDDYHSIDKEFNEFKKMGCNVEYVSDFTRKTVNERTDGIKKLRNLVKLKTIDSKDPNFIYQFFKYDGLSPITKTFYDYFDKIEAENFIKKTSYGIPAWWSGYYKEDFQFLLSKVKRENIIETSSSGMPYCYYLTKTSIHHPHNNHVSKYALNWLKEIHKKDPEFIPDYWYVDKNNNNILHHILDISTSPTHGKQLDDEFLTAIRSVNLEKFFEMLFSKNSNDLTPIELLLSKKENQNWSVNKFYNFLVENHEMIDYSLKDKNNYSIFNSIAERVKDEKGKELIIKSGEAFLLNQILPQKIKNQDSKNLKI